MPQLEGIIKCILDPPIDRRQWQSFSQKKDDYQIHFLLKKRATVKAEATEKKEEFEGKPKEGFKQEMTEKKEEKQEEREGEPKEGFKQEMTEKKEEKQEEREEESKENYEKKKL